MAKILVTGGSGQIGSRVVERLGEIFSPQDKIYLLKRNREIGTIDESVRDNVETIKDLNSQIYDFAFHLAANIHTKFNQDLEWIPKFYIDNVKLTEEVAKLSGKVLMTSTDNVFRGKDKNIDYKESDEPNPNPRNTYGITKTIAEDVVLKKDGAVIRIQTMLGVKSNLIINRVFNAIDGEKYFPFWKDTFSKPSYFEDLLKVAKVIYNESRRGIYHVSTNGSPDSRADIAYKVLGIHQRLGLPVQRTKFLTEGCNDSDFPKYLVLDTQKTQQEMGINFTSVNQALENHVLYARGKTS